MDPQPLRAAAAPAAGPRPAAGPTGAARDVPVAGSYARGVAYVLAAALAFGTLGTLSNLAYRAGMSAPMFTVLRAGVGALTLAVLIALAGRRTVTLRRLPRAERVSLGIAIVANATLNLALFAAYGAMSVVLVLAVYFTYPLLVNLASVALGRERFTPARVVGLLLAGAGLALVLASQAGPDAAITAAGLAFAGLAAACQATYLVVSRAGYTRVPSDQATMLILAGGVVLALPLALVAGPQGASADGVGAGSAFTWIADPDGLDRRGPGGHGGCRGAKVWLLRGVRRIGGTRTAVLMLAEPLFGVVLAAVFLGQAITPAEVAGGALVLLAALLVQRPAGGPALGRPPPVHPPVQPAGPAAGRRDAGGRAPLMPRPGSTNG